MDLVSLLPGTPCDAATDWLRSLPEGTTPQQAWDQCPRADWMFWLYAQRTPDVTVMVRIALEIARTVQHLNTDARIGACLDTVGHWLADPTGVSLQNLGATAYAADAAAAWAAWEAAWVADAAEEAAWAAAWAARAAARAAHADIVRRYLPVVPA